MGFNKEMESALNSYFSEQAIEPGTCLVDYVQFDGLYEKVFEDRPVSWAKAVIEPRGMTALYDAIGRGSYELGKKFANMPESRRPGKVLVLVVTDGLENASREWTAGALRDLIRKQEDKYSWEYVFLGANMDAVEVAQTFGIKASNSLTYDTAYAGAAMATVSGLTSTYRAGGHINITDEDRKNAVQKS